VIRNAVEAVPTSWPEYRTASAVSAGLSEEQAQAIGIADLGGAGSLPLAEIIVGGDIDVTLDADAISEQLPEGSE
jgi:hypothetical protein